MPKLELKQLKMDHFMDKLAISSSKKLPMTKQVLADEKLCEANILKDHDNIGNIDANITQISPNITVTTELKLHNTSTIPPTLVRKLERFSEIKSSTDVVRLPNPSNVKTKSGLDQKKIELIQKKGRKYKCFGRKEDDRILVKSNTIKKYFPKIDPSKYIYGKRKLENEAETEILKKLRVGTSDYRTGES